MQMLTKMKNPLGGALAGETLARIAGRARGLSGAFKLLVRAVAALALDRVRTALGDLRHSGARRRRLRVVESLALGGRRQLLLVTCDEQEYLVGTGAERVETIVLRQPGQAQAGLSQASSSQIGLGMAEAAHAGPAGPVQSGSGLPGVARVKRAGAIGSPRRRGDETNGPRLVMQENRSLREADNGKGRELWR